jgi:hypothetical protein
METRFLLPNKFKLIGWILLIPSSILGLFVIFGEFKLSILEFNVFTISSSGFAPWEINKAFAFAFEKENLTATIVGILFLLGALMVTLAREKNEDEFISKKRLESLLWATIVNFIILLFCFVFFYELGFIYVMIFNMFTILILFIVRFNYVLYNSSKSLKHEK